MLLRMPVKCLAYPGYVSEIDGNVAGARIGVRLDRYFVAGDRPA